MNVKLNEVCNTLWSLSPFDLYSASATNSQSKTSDYHFKKNGDSIAREEYSKKSINFLMNNPFIEEGTNHEYIALNKRKVGVWLTFPTLIGCCLAPKETSVLLVTAVTMFALGKFWDYKNLEMPKFLNENRETTLDNILHFPSPPTAA